MKATDVEGLAKTSCIKDPEQAIKATITAKANYALVNKKMFKPDEPAVLKWTVFGTTDGEYPPGYTLAMFEEIAVSFGDIGYETTFGPGEYPDTYELMIREPGNG
jgi:hypothetical protein